MENVLYELMKDNMWKSVHEKTMENLRNRIYVKLMRNKKGYLK